MNSFGSKYRFTIFGQSHSEAIGVTIEGLPAGFAPDFERLQKFLDRRAPGRSETATARREEDIPQIVCGIKDGVCCGAPLTALILNKNARSGDYEHLRDVPRPGHADYAAMVKFGESRDYAGGGQFSGRLMAPLCIAGGLALQILEREGIEISARTLSIHGKSDEKQMREEILRAKAGGDSVGGIIECVATGVSAGLGSPLFGGVENVISQAVFAIGGIKAIEFGNGFSCASLFGSENNDEFEIENGEIRTKTNNHGGSLGGITSGMPIVFRVAVKPTPSIEKTQQSINFGDKTVTSVSARGRHDPCIVPRAIACVEAAAAVALYNLLLEV